MIVARRTTGALLSLLLTGCAVGRPPAIAEPIASALRITALDHPSAVSGWRLDFEDPELGLAGWIEVWTLAGRLHGNAKVGERSASWRMRFEADGELAPERWKTNLDGDPRAAAALRRIATKLAASRANDGRTPAALAMIELALELTRRTYERRDRNERLVWSG